MPESAVDLHRLIWSPDDFDGDALTTSAFPKNDLMGVEKHATESHKEGESAIKWTRPQLL